ncbi:MAG: hypothetical protein WCD69_26870 [Xanthobacteraceae bacterium]
MPTYTFKLLDGCGGAEDATGITLSGHNDAIGYGRDIVHELMKNREPQTRSWRLDIYEEGDGPIRGIPFASVDPTLDHLRSEARATVEAISERKRSLSEVFHAVNITITESCALVARSRGRPYLASRFGKATIRDR